MKSLPEKIDFSIEGNKKSKGFLIMLTLVMSSKNNYNFIVGPTDEKGNALISQEELMHKASCQLKLAVMDYHHIEREFTGELKARIMSAKEIKSAIEAYEIYETNSYEEGYINMLNQALNNSKVTSDLILHVNQK